MAQEATMGSAAEADEVTRWHGRRRSGRVIRRRLRQGRWWVALLGAVLAVLVIRSQLAQIHAAQGAIDSNAELGAGLLFVLATVGPWLIVELVRRWTERRFYWEWQ